MVSGISGISGVGIDLVRIERIARWMERPGMVERFFHPEEIDAATSRGAGAAASLAARFAAKEAFGKALGTGLAGLELRDIWVHNDERGQPFITLQGSSAELFAAQGGGTVHCSLSHEKDYAIALVVIETKHQENTLNG
ncbi:MAG TPA: holo-ACP synthase [Spirochaetales bacterium]|nr:holo-ACP synthase [Spirochaetales bacterium]HPS14596.1 holo-ACP synthase [Spirochaetales bacterium]